MTAPKRKALKEPRHFVTVDHTFDRTHEASQDGTVRLSGYKSAIILELVATSPTKECGCPQPRPSHVWLRGHDFDNLIALLRDAKRAWMKAYRAALKEDAT